MNIINRRSFLTTALSTLTIGIAENKVIFRKTSVHKELKDYITLHNPYPRNTPIYYKWICKLSKKYKLDPMLLARQINVESSFINYAVSNKGAVGCLQVIPYFWSQKLYEINDSELHKALLKTGDHTRYLKRIPYGMEAGCLVFDYYLKKHKEYALALVAYNCGDSLWYTQDDGKQVRSAFYKAKKSLKYRYNFDYVKKILFT